MIAQKAAVATAVLAGRRLAVSSSPDIVQRLEQQAGERRNDGPARR